MTPRFESGRSGKGAAYVADRSGSAHARFMRVGSFALAPLNLLALWFIAETAGQPLEGVRAVIGRPFPAIVLVAFGLLSLWHAHAGMQTIIEDYVHDAAALERANKANAIAAVAIAALWTLAIMIVAAPK